MFFQSNCCWSIKQYSHVYLWLSLGRRYKVWSIIDFQSLLIREYLIFIYSNVVELGTYYWYHQIKENSIKESKFVHIRCNASNLWTLDSVIICFSMWWYVAVKITTWLVVVVQLNSFLFIYMFIFYKIPFVLFI